jgi:hypothetical protein
VLEPGPGVEVTEYLLGECRQAGCPLDLRLQQKSLLTYLQWSMVKANNSAASEPALDQGLVPPRRRRLY